MDAIYCAGDYVDYGIGSARGDRLGSGHHGAHCVMGNHDRHLLNILFSARWMRFGEQIATNGCTTTANGDG